MRIAKYTLLCRYGLAGKHVQTAAGCELNFPEHENYMEKFAKIKTTDAREDAVRILINTALQCGEPASRD